MSGLRRDIHGQYLVNCHHLDGAGPRRQPDLHPRRHLGRPVEILLGVIAGNFFNLQPNDWINFLATFGSGLLTFLAGAEIDLASLRSHLKPSLAIGIVSFALPFLGVFAVAYWGIGWTLQGAEIVGITLSTTSVAVVYAVMIDTGLNTTELGKLILAACFVTDLGTVLALGILFANFNGWLAVFVVVTALVLWRLPQLTRWVMTHLHNRSSEPEIKFLFLILFFLGWLATAANSEAVLPAYLVGLVVASAFLTDKVLVHRMRAIAFALLTPFYFIKAGLYVTLPALVAGAGLIALLLGLKITTKFLGVWPLTQVFRLPARVGNYTTLLMSTGLTFGTISALYGFTNHLITQTFLQPAPPRSACPTRQAGPRRQPPSWAIRPGPRRTRLWPSPSSGLRPVAGVEEVWACFTKSVVPMTERRGRGGP